MVPSEPPDKQKTNKARKYCAMLRSDPAPYLCCDQLCDAMCSLSKSETLFIVELIIYVSEREMFNCFVL